MISDPLLLLAFMFAVVAFTRFLEKRFTFVERISSAVLCTLLGITFANIGVIPTTVESVTNATVFEFATDLRGGTWTADRRRVLAMRAAAPARDASATVILNWARLLENDDR